MAEDILATEDGPQGAERARRMAPRADHQDGSSPVTESCGPLYAPGAGRVSIPDSEIHPCIAFASAGVVKWIRLQPQSAWVPAIEYQPGDPAIRSAAACHSALSASRKGSSRRMRAKWGRALKRSWWLFQLRFGPAMLRALKTGQRTVFAALDHPAAKRAGEHDTRLSHDDERAIAVIRLLADHKAIKAALQGGAADQVPPTGGAVIDRRPARRVPRIEVVEVAGRRVEHGTSCNSRART